LTTDNSIRQHGRQLIGSEILASGKEYDGSKQKSESSQSASSSRLPRLAEQDRDDHLVGPLAISFDDKTDKVSHIAE
jgi:hypothetical protein